MATSTVARIMARCFVLAPFLVALISASTVTPSNSTIDEGVTQLRLSAEPNLPYFNIAPLTAGVGRGSSDANIAGVTFSGNIKLTDPANMNNITGGDIAYISCDPNVAANSGFIDASSVLSTVENNKPRGIVLYSLTSNNCNITSQGTYETIYTMTTASSAQQLYMAIHNPPQSTSILTATVQSNGTHVSSGSSSSTNNDGGPAPTTAVAMSILYSITGIITLLFLVIIATGAIRAHRHPERYGPRTGVAGRPRQSRAKGLARAMLETLPIVKFGDPEPVKPGAERDIELEGGNAVAQPSTEATVTDVTPATQHAKDMPAAAIESGLGPAAKAESIKDAPAAKTGSGEGDGDLGCSICTENFTTGEDVRVLPCNHKYHPACIDPWLLNVSGTCPLCRHDLRPANAEAEAAAEGDELPPPLSANEEADATNTAPDATTDERRPRAYRLIDLHRLRTAPPDERIAALRRLREESRQQGGAAEDTEEPSRRARLTGRLRDTFRIRTRRGDEPQPPPATTNES